MSNSLKLVIFGVIAIIISIVMFAIAIQQLDTAITTAGATTNTFTGLTDIMGIYGVLLWIVISSAGLGMLGFGTAATIRGRMGGGSSRKKSRKSRKK